MSRKIAANVIVPYVLCVFLGCVILGMAFWPSHPNGFKDSNVIAMSKGSSHNIKKRGLKDPFSDFAGAVYIRWGRLTCTDQASLVYEGAAAGGYFNHPGAATNIQCMPRHPTWGRHKDAFYPTKGFRSYIYGVEYRTQTDDFPFTQENADALLHHNLPCAVCISKLRSTQLMIPGRAECVDGWHLEYSGYLMAGDHQQVGASQYVCVDKDPEADPAGYRKESSHLLVIVEGQCGSLPCPPYVSGREIACVVCSK